MNINIIPKPNHLQISEVKFNIGSNSVMSGNFPTAIDSAKTFFQKLKKVENPMDIAINKKQGFSTEGYEIQCHENTVSVNASTLNGAFYGLITLFQIAKFNVGVGCYVKDIPKYSWRGFMLDSARHFWTVEQIKQMLDIMALFKINKFHWHLTDDQGWRAEIKKYPELTQIGAIRASTALSLKGYNSHREPRDKSEYGRGLFYTQQDMIDIVAYAKAKCIEVIPEVDMPGHLVAVIACYPELSCEGVRLPVADRWGVNVNIGCCGNEKLYSFAKDVIDELCEIFPSKYFHIGGDEVPKDKWKKCPKCQAKIKEENLKDENDLQAYFNNVICQYLKSKNRNMIGWNEILESDKIDAGVAVQWWTKFPNCTRELDWLNQGNSVILSLLDYVYMDHPFCVRSLPKTYSFNAKLMGIEDDSKVLGVEIPQWTEYIREIDHFNYNTYVRLMAMAEVGWTKDEIKDYDSFENALESMRQFFSEMDIIFPPKFIYRGEVIKKPLFSKKEIKGMKLWRKNPKFEYYKGEK